MAVDFSSIKLKKLTINGKDFLYYPSSDLQEMRYAIDQLPFSIRILLESALRQRDELTITDKHIQALADWTNPDWRRVEIAFKSYHNAVYSRAACQFHNCT